MLLIVLTGIACTRGGRSTGLLIIDIASAPDLATLLGTDACGDERYLVAVAKGHAQVKLNMGPAVPSTEAVQRIHEVMRFRAQKVVFVKADADVPWGQFVEMVDRVWPEADVVSIVTPRVEALAAQRYCLSPSCRDCVRGLGALVIEIQNVERKAQP